MTERVDIVARYGVPREVKFCKRCTISNQRPRIVFDEEGICGACRYAEYKRSIDWEQREDELADLCQKFRKKRGYDVIVPCSGGKDGSFTAHYLKVRHAMTPLTCTWAPNVYTDIGRQNLENFIDVGGFDHVLGRANGNANRKLVRLGFERIGDPFQSFIYGQTNFPLTIAVKYDVPLLMYGENGEVEYGGDMKNAYRPTRDIEDHEKHYFSGVTPESLIESGLTERDIEAYMAPSMKEIEAVGIEIHFMGYYHFWDPQENFYYAIEHTGFQPNPLRSEGTYSKYASLDDQIDGFHYYMAYIKFGIGRATSDSAHEIRDGKITREEGIALVRRFDGEFPRRYFQVFLDYTGLTEEEFYRIVDSWRGEHIWEDRGGNRGWELKSPIWAMEEEESA